MATEKQVVLGIFDDEGTAQACSLDLKDWAPGLAIDVSSMAILVLDSNGKLKVDNVGGTRGGKGAGIGLAIAMLTPVGLAAGLIGGGILGKLHHKGLGLSNEAREQIGKELQDGKAAVAIVSDPSGCEAISAQITFLGGKAQVHELDPEAVAAAEAAAATEAATATEEAATATPS